jgi:hypothetical protein
MRMRGANAFELRTERRESRSPSLALRSRSPRSYCIYRGRISEQSHESSGETATDLGSKCLGREELGWSRRVGRLDDDI